MQSPYGQLRIKSLAGFEQKLPWQLIAKNFGQQLFVSKFLLVCIVGLIYQTSLQLSHPHQLQLLSNLSGLQTVAWFLILSPVPHCYPYYLKKSVYLTKRCCVPCLSPASDIPVNHGLKLFSVWLCFQIKFCLIVMKHISLHLRPVSCMLHDSSTKTTLP